MEEFFRKYRYAIQIVGIAVYLLFALGGFFLSPSDKSVTDGLNAILFLSLLLATTAAYWAARYFILNAEYHSVWNWMAVSLTFWCLAEARWFLFPEILTSRGVRPDLADMFWLLGSIAMIRVLILYYFSLHTRPEDRSTMIDFSILLTALISTPFLISIPSFLSGDLLHFLGLAVKCGYIGLDLSILAFSGILIIPKKRSPLPPAWTLIAISLIISSLASLLHFYLAWDAPLTGRQVIFPTIFYTISNLVLAANVYTAWLLGQQIGLGVKLKLGFIGKDREIPQFLIHTESHGIIVFVSKNFLQFTNNSLPERFIGKSLQEVFGLSPQEYDNLSNTCSRGGFVAQYDIKISAGQKAPVPLFLTAVGSIAEHEYFGMDMILHLPNYSGQAYPLDPESSAITQGILKRTGQHSKENAALLADYFIAHLQAFKELIGSTNDSKIAVAMDREINNAAEKNKWPIRLSGLELSIEPGFDYFDNAELTKALPVLYKIARQYTIKVCSAETVEEQTEMVDKTLNEKMVLAARRFGLRPG